jgi:peptide/nickel transport system substrate-binding protein
MIDKNHWILVSLSISIFFFISCAEKSNLTETKNILKIGTTRVGIKSASLLGDTFISLFAQISNPPLTTMNAQGEIEGLVADNVVVNEDNTVWKFFLAPDLFWSDGAAVTAEDALFSIAVTTEKVPHARWLKDMIVNVSVEGDFILVIELVKSYSRLDLDLATFNLIPKHIWEKIPDPARHISKNGIVGCGPFVIDRIDLNAGLISYRKNPYWKGPQPELGGLEVHLYNNIDVLALALEKGEVDTYY